MEKPNPASNKLVSTFWPAPVRSRDTRAASTPTRQYRPAPTSVDGHSRFDGPAFLIARHAHDPAERLRHDVVAALTREGTGRPVAGDGGVHEAHVELRDRVIADAETLRRARPEALDDDVAALRETVEEADG